MTHKKTANFLDQRVTAVLLLAALVFSVSHTFIQVKALLSSQADTSAISNTDSISNYRMQRILQRRNSVSSSSSSVKRGQSTTTLQQLRQSRLRKINTRQSIRSKSRSSALSTDVTTRRSRSFSSSRGTTSLPIGYLATGKGRVTLPAVTGVSNDVVVKSNECINATLVSRERTIDELREDVIGGNIGEGLYRQGQFYFQNGGDAAKIYALFSVASTYEHECASSLSEYMSKALSTNDINRSKRFSSTYEKSFSATIDVRTPEADHRTVEERNEIRRQAVNLLVNTVNMYAIKNNGQLPAGLKDGQAGEICATNATSCAGLIQLEPEAREYLYRTALPIDPLYSITSNKTGYYIWKDGYQYRVKALNAEGGIEVSAPNY